MYVLVSCFVAAFILWADFLLVFVFLWLDLRNHSQSDLSLLACSIPITDHARSPQLDRALKHARKMLAKEPEDPDLIVVWVSCSVCLVLRLWQSGPCFFCPVDLTLSVLTCHLRILGLSKSVIS